MIENNVPHVGSPVRIVVVGAGNRARTYMHYVKANPGKAKLVAVVEPDKVRRDFLADQFGIPEEMRFCNCKEVFSLPRLAEAAVICSPEKLHYDHCMLAIEAGYHILLEKPIAQTLQECEEIARKADEKRLRVSVCHVLRHHPLFAKIKELIDSGKYGDIISISHMEEVGIDRYTHSFVRGTMNRERDNNPMLLAKCCHDLDFLLWIVDARCRKVSSFGSLRWFREENAPAGSALRCVDCQVEGECPYSAIDLYKRRRDWIGSFIPAPGEMIDDVIDRELKEGRFGRCVYRCDNDVVDNQVVAIEMDNGMLISLIINAFTQCDCRNIEIKMTLGEISCYGDMIKARHFRSREISAFDFSHLGKIPHHGGADMAVIGNFIDSLLNPELPLISPLKMAIESHHVIFEAERSRHTGKTIKFKTND